MTYANYSYATNFRPRIMERIGFVVMKLSLELSVAAILYFVTADMAGRTIAQGGFVETVLFVLLCSAVFGYAPFVFAMAFLWGLTPRHWRPFFPRVLTMLSALYLAIGCLVVGPELALNVALIGMLVASFAALAIAIQLFADEEHEDFAG